MAHVQRAFPLLPQQAPFLLWDMVIHPTMGIQTSWFNLSQSNFPMNGSVITPESFQNWVSNHYTPTYPLAIFHWGSSIPTKNGASKKRWRRRWPTGPARLPSVRDMRRSEGPAMFAKSDNQAVKVGLLPSGKHIKNYGKCPFIVDLPIENGDVP